MICQLRLSCLALILLTCIFNKSINECSYPDFLKVAQVILIYKSGGDQTICSNRPISIMLQFNKILKDSTWWTYFPNIHSVLRLNLQHMQLRVFTQCCWAMLITGYIVAPYFLIWQGHLIPLITFYLINFIITLVLEEFPYNYFAGYCPITSNS